LYAHMNNKIFKNTVFNESVYIWNTWKVFCKIIFFLNITWKWIFLPAYLSNSLKEPNPF
jgi:hypothetical protein